MQVLPKYLFIYCTYCPKPCQRVLRCRFLVICRRLSLLNLINYYRLNSAVRILPLYNLPDNLL